MPTQRPGPPLIDFGKLAEIPQAYFQAQERRQQEAFRDALRGGLPRGPGGEIDYGALASLAAQFGQTPVIETMSRLQQGAAAARRAEAQMFETARHNRASEDISRNRPQVIGSAAAGYWLVDANGNRIGPAPGPPQQQQDDSIWRGPQGKIPTGEVPSIGPQSAVTPELSASERALAEMAPPARGGGPQFAQAGGPTQLPQMAQAQLPPWVGGAAAPIAPRAAPPPAAGISPRLQPLLPGNTPSTPRAPSGERWIDPSDPSKGLEPVPGGTKEKIDAEVAARMGLGLSWLGQLDDFTDAEGRRQKGLRSRLREGATFGPVNTPMAWAGFGGPGEARRIQDSGAEALLRNLTGAGMSENEARDYVRRYKFQVTDTPETSLSKINQLERELRFTMEVVGRGRGGVPNIEEPFRNRTPSQRTGPPPVGHIEDNHRFKGGDPSKEANWERLK